MDIPADLRMAYRLDPENFVTVSATERWRTGPKTTERMSSLSFTTTDLSGHRIRDADTLLRQRAERLVTNTSMKNLKVLKNEAFTFKGQPARELIYTFTTDVIGSPAAHRCLFVASGDRLHLFAWVWGAGPVPADSERMFNSIRFTSAQADGNARSRALLETTIVEYWLREKYPNQVHFTPALRAIADSKRVAESQIVDGYGPVQEVEFRGTENGYRVFRIEHNDAVVDWYIADNGAQISGLTWKKVRDIEGT